MAKPDKNKFCETKFGEFLKVARFQFVLKSEKYVYFIPLPAGCYYNDLSFIGHNEVTGSVDIISYDDIREVLVDGKKYFF